MRAGCKQCVDWQNEVRNSGKWGIVTGFLTSVAGAITLLVYFHSGFALNQGEAGSVIVWCTFLAIFLALTGMFFFMFMKTFSGRKKYFHFLDKTGELHCHRTMPVVVQLDSKDETSKRYLWIDPQFEHPTGEETEHGVLPLSDFTVASSILEVHLGGLRNRHRVWILETPGIPHPWWEIVRRRGFRLEVRDIGDDSVTATPLMVLKILRQVDKIATRFHSGIADELENIEAELARRKSLEAQLDRVRGLLDWLGIGITKLKTKLQESQRATRSPIGQMAREQLEALLGACTADQSDHWMRGEPTPDGKDGYEHIQDSQPHPNPPQNPEPETT